MANAQPALVFFGTDDFSVPALVALIKHNYHIVALVTKVDARTGRGQELVSPAVKTVAAAHGIMVLQPERVADISAQIASLRPAAAIVVAYGNILPATLIAQFPLGLINIHASLLPRYRGASPIEAAILNGDADTGVTLMQIDAGMDTGPIYAQTRLKLHQTETQPELYHQLSQLGSALLIEQLPDILSGSLSPEAQNPNQATNVKMIKKSDGVIDWTKQALAIERQIRAYTHWPRSRSTIAGRDVVIGAAHIESNSNDAPGTVSKSVAGELTVSTGDGILVIDRLQPAGKREMSGREFLAGHPLKSDQT